MCSLKTTNALSNLCCGQKDEIDSNTTFRLHINYLVFGCPGTEKYYQQGIDLGSIFNSVTHSIKGLDTIDNNIIDLPNTTEEV